MKKYRYVIVCCNGSNYDLNREASFYPYGLGGTMVYDLPELLRHGSRPVRQTPMGGAGDTNAAWSLVLLEKEAVEEPAPVFEAAEE